MVRVTSGWVGPVSGMVVGLLTVMSCALSLLRSLWPSGLGDYGTGVGAPVLHSIAALVLAALLCDCGSLAMAGVGTVGISGSDSWLHCVSTVPSTLVSQCNARSWVSGPWVPTVGRMGLLETSPL